MKIKAWTLAEMAIGLAIVMLLTYATMTITKSNNNNKAKLFVYGAIKNIAMGNGSISDKYGEFFPEGTDETAGAWYCNEIKDVFALANDPNCADVNAIFKFGNGLTIQGLAKNWTAPYKYKNASCTASYCKETPDFWYKNLLIDINGNGVKPDKLGVDRFPMRLYKGFSAMGADLSGIVYPACGTYDYVNDPNGTKRTMTTGGYCESGFNFLEDRNVVSYNIYKADNILSKMKERSGGEVYNGGTMKDKNVTATLVQGSMSFMEADCMAYAGNGFFNKLQCSAAGYRLHPDCAHYDMCTLCNDSLYGTNYNVCPADYNTQAKCRERATAINSHTNVDRSCFVLLNKPMGGLGFLGGALMGDLDM